MVHNRKDSRYSEKDAARIVRQMLNVAARCHLNGVVHRDMKPEVCSRTTCMDMLMGRFVDDAMKSCQWQEDCHSLYEFIICTMWTPHNSAHRLMRILDCSEFPFQVSKGGITSQGHWFWAIWLYQSRYRTLLFPLESCCISHNILQLLGTIWSALELSSVNTGYPFRFLCRQKVPWCGGKCILCCPRGVEEKIWPRVWCVEYWCHHLHLALWKAPFLGQDWGWHL